MIWPDDEQIVDRDRSIPGLRLLLDRTLATNLFGTSFPRLGILDARCYYLRYKVGTSCVASFSLHTKARSIFAHAIAHRTDAVQKIEKAALIAAKNPGLRVILKHQFLVLSLFPLDDDLQSLLLLADSSKRSTFFDKLAPYNRELLSAQITELRYKPHRRFVGRLDIDEEPQATLKLHSADEYQQARRAAKSFGAVDGISHATVFGHSDRHRAILQKWVHGQPLAERVLERSVDLFSLGTELGSILKRLHGHPTLKLPRLSVKQRCCSLNNITREIASLCPQLAEQSYEAITKANHLLLQLNRPLASLHGDLNLDQIIANDRLSLIDFDNAALGHAELDLGNLLAHFARLSATGRLSATVVDGVFDSLMHEYTKQGGQAESSATHLYAAICLLGMLQEPFRYRMANWKCHSEGILDQAKKQLERAVASKKLTTAPVPSPDIFEPAVSAFLTDQSLAEAHSTVDLNKVRQHILPVLKEKLDDETLQLWSLRLVRHKRGKRCLVEYTCNSLQRGGLLRILGKAYSKRKHLETHRYQSALWLNGFGYDSVEHIYVPRPLGVLDTWRMCFQEHISGIDGWKAIANDPTGVSLKILHAVEKLQSFNLSSDRCHTTTDEMKLLRSRLDEVAHDRPDLRKRIESLIDYCQALAYAIPEEPMVPSHRDFYPDQIILSSRGLHLVDFDLFCFSLPGLDLGNFYAHLIERAIREQRFAKVAGECAKQFKAHYINTGRDRAWKSVEAFTTLTLARHVYLSTLFDNRSNYTHAILEMCERRLGDQLADNYWHCSEASAIPLHSNSYSI